MKRRKPWIRITCIFLLLACYGLTGVKTTAQNKKIAIFGSSVAKGSGDTTSQGGYAGLIAELMQNRGWHVINVSKGGDNTVKIMPRFETQLLPEHPRFVIIGLSLGNEGITASTEVDRERIFERFRSGLLHLIGLCRDSGMYPVVVNCYARNDFGREQYEATKRMNLIIDTWDVPCIDALGAIDNGKGNWAEGYWHDKSHPNFKGHKEIFYSFVPSLFDAIEAGKKVPAMVCSKNYLSITSGPASAPLVFLPDDTIHSFSVCFKVKTNGQGIIAAVNKDGPGAFLEEKGGKIFYHSSAEERIEGMSTEENKGWQYITLVHQYASGLTFLYTNGHLAGSINEKLDFKEFILGGTRNRDTVKAPEKAGYRDLLIYRSALNPDEVLAQYYDRLLPASLEIYAPFDDIEFKPGYAVNNYAQSLSKLIVKSDQLVSVTEETGVTIK